MAIEFPLLFLCVRDRQAKFSSYMARSGDHLQWDPVFRTNLTEEEENQFMSLLQILNQVSISDEGQDRTVWRASQDGAFLVSSFFSVIVSSSPLTSLC